jgi:hypothetical protein
MAMKKLRILMLLLMFAALFISCARATPEPAGRPGNISVEEHAGGAEFSDLGEYCGDYQSTAKEPGIHTVHCEVPLLPRLQIEFGWGAKDDAILDSNWNAMTWELDIDDKPINLDDFAPFDERTSGIVGSQEFEIRGWRLDLVNVSPGKHTLRFLWRSETPIDDGFDVYPPGSYENIVNFTVPEE